MTPPEVVNATQAQLDNLLAKVKSTLTAQEYLLLEGVLGTFICVMLALQNAKTSINRFRKMLFGASTESKGNVLKDKGKDKAASGEPPVAGEATSTECDPESESAKPKPKAKAKPGHGRIGAQAYRDAPVVKVDVVELQSGNVCPECTDGKVYNTPPRTIVKVIGQPPLVATVYELGRLRCRLCDATFTAPMPSISGGLTAPKYDHSCASMLAILRYGSGMPFFRLEGLQRSLNVPLPDATQWKIVSDAVPAPRAMREELIRHCAQAPLIHLDDTTAQILALQVQRNKLEAAGKTPQAKAINTSGFVAVLPQGRKVALYFTGHKHAGQNLDDILALRARELGPPTQMSDALACNFVSVFKTIIAKCLSHGRRMFVDIFEHFPQQCRHVIEVLAHVYAMDAHCRDEKMSAQQRLEHHQAHSDPPMQGLHRWMTEQFDKRLIEPNSGLGGALRYMLNHWAGLTLFLRQAGAPLDNNLCERLLKRAIRHRGNSMFFKTQYGAEVGDIYMSLISTCELCGINPFGYLQALQLHCLDVIATPALWLPWNYHEQLARAA
jgi:transposase